MSGELRITLDESFIEGLAESLAQRLLELNPPSAQHPRWLYGAKAAADYLGWPPGRVYKTLRRLPHRRDGNALIFSTAELDEYLNSLYLGPDEFAPAVVAVPAPFLDRRNRHE